MGYQGELPLHDTAATSRRHRHHGVLRRLAAVAAPVAKDAGSVIDDIGMLDAARDICRVVLDEDAAGGLARGEVFDRTGWPEQRRPLFESRFSVFEQLELMRPVLDKAHQQRYTLNPFGMAGVLMFDRASQHGGVDELLVPQAWPRRQYPGHMPRGHRRHRENYPSSRTWPESCCWSSVKTTARRWRFGSYHRATAVWPKVAWPTEPTDRTTLSTPASTDAPATLVYGVGCRRAVR